MKSAQEVLKSREEKRQQRLKENQDQINKELLEFEKALNKYESNIDDEKPYITVDTIIKTPEVKTLLQQNGYIIDKISNDIKVNTTRVYLNETSYNEAIDYAKHVSKRMTYKSMCDPFKVKEVEERVKREKQINEDIDEIDYPTTVEDWINSLKVLSEINRRRCY